MEQKRHSPQLTECSSPPTELIPLQERNAEVSFVQAPEESNVDNSNVPTEPIKTTTKRRYTRRQWTFFVVICFINLCASMCYSLQAPFFPKEKAYHKQTNVKLTGSQHCFDCKLVSSYLALHGFSTVVHPFGIKAGKKGASATVCGLVFGVFELVDFIFCPIYGKYIRQIGPVFMLNAGNFLMGSCVILFGMLDRTPAGTPFIALAFAIRIVEALGQAGYFTSVYAIIAHEFPESIASTFSILETTFGFGMLLGPTVGGLLYEVDGYYLPFVVVGSCLLSTALITALILPKIEDAKSPSISILKLLVIPSVLICYYSVFAVAFSYGFAQALLEMHLRQFQLSPSLTGLLFIINGGVYALTAAIWGFIADKHVHPKVLCGAGGIFIALGFLLIGPAPFIPVDTTLWIVIVGLVLHGLGTGGEYVAAFVDSSQSAMRHGFPDNIETYGLIAGLWASGLALGSFVGPSVAGILYDAVGFRNATMIVFGLHVLVVILSFGYLLAEKWCPATKRVSEVSNDVF